MGLWSVPQALYRSSLWIERKCYLTAIRLRLGFAVQLRLLPSQFLERPVFVRPSSITHSITQPHPPGLTPVLDGDWDLEPELLTNDVGNWGFHFRLIYEMLVENKPYYETSQFKEMEHELSTKGETVNHKFRSMEEVLQYIKKYEPIINDINANGYKTQEELGEPPFANEIRVGIGRSGDILFLGQGNHRLAMAKILDLELVPVSVWTVHKIWAEGCFQKYGGGMLEAVYEGLSDIDHHHAGIMRLGMTNTQEPKLAENLELEMAGDPVEPNTRDNQTVDSKSP